jgi:formamidopyrimidine-DNA glycosylase
VRRELEPWLAGRVVAAAELLAPPGPKYVGLERAAGQRVLSVGRRGKFILVPLSGGDELVLHLGMTGSLSPEEPADHVRVRLHLLGDGPSTIYFRDPRRFGRFLLVRAGDYEALPTLRDLGPEPFDPEFTAERFAANLARSRAPVKAYLLSQRPIAGVGNIYADEGLWRARVHPLTPAASLRGDQAEALLAALREVLAESLAANGTTLRDYRRLGGETGGFYERLAVYGKDGQPCPRCGAAMERSVVGGRGTVHCPVCQPAPRRVSGRSARRAGGPKAGPARTKAPGRAAPRGAARGGESEGGGRRARSPKGVDDVR